MTIEEFIVAMIFKWEWGGEITDNCLDFEHWHTLFLMIQINS